MNDWLNDTDMGRASGPSQPFNTSTISMKDFLDEMRQPPESFSQEVGDEYLQGVKMGADPLDATQDPSGMPPEAGSLPDPGVQNTAQAKYTARFLVGTMDTGVGNVCKMISRASSAKPYQATPEEKSDMVEVWAEYLKTVGGDIPPGVLALMVTGVVYGPKVAQAFIDRKVVQELKQQKETIDEQAVLIKDLRERLQKLEKQAA